MAIAASKVLARVRSLLVDDGTAYRWSTAELLKYLSDGQRTIAAAFPDQVTKVSNILLVEGTRQSLPSDGESLVTVYRNMGVAGTTPGRAVRLIKREILDDQNPNWHADAKVTAVYNYIYDPNDPTAFFVYPPSNGLGYVQINYSYNPAELTADTDNITVGDIYLTPLVDYVLYRAHQKDSDEAAGQEKANTHLQAFMMFLAARDSSDKELSPNQSFGPFNPSVSGASR